MMKRKGVLVLGIVAVLIVLLIVILFFVIKNNKNKENEVTQAAETEIVQTVEEKQTEIDESEEIVIRYEEAKLGLLEDESQISEKYSVENLAPYVKLLETKEFLFREENMNIDIYHAGTIYVPKDISSSELTKLTNHLSRVVYAKYQEENPETNSEYVIFSGNPEAEFDRMNYSEYDYFEHKKLSKVMVWGDENLSTIEYSAEFGVIVDIFFY